MHFWHLTVLSKCNSTIQKRLIETCSDDVARAIFNSYGWSDFWIKRSERFPEFKEAIISTDISHDVYLAEKGFSQVLYVCNKYRNRLDMNKSEGNALRLALKNLADKHRAQGSH